MALWPSNLIKLLRFLKVKASKSTFGLWLLRFLRFRRPAGTIMALLLFAALLLLLILMLLVFKFYNEFITCFHESWIYETWFFFPMKFPVFFISYQFSFDNENRLKKVNIFQPIFFHEKKVLKIRIGENMWWAHTLLLLLLLLFSLLLLALETRFPTEKQNKNGK